VTFEGVKWWRYFNGGRYMITDLRSSRGKSTTCKIGFYPGHLEERLTGGTQRTTGLMMRYEVVMEIWQWRISCKSHSSLWKPPAILLHWGKEFQQLPYMHTAQCSFCRPWFNLDQLVPREAMPIHSATRELNVTDVKRGQNLEAEAEAEAKAIRGRGQFLEVEAKAEVKNKNPSCR